jgi:short-subunit dehydrogenase
VYCASKAAIESIGDALRIELRPWGIPVSLIEPNATATEMWSDAGEMVDATAAAMSPEHRALYEGHIEGVRRGVPTMQRRAVPVSNVVDVVEKAVECRSPRARYLVGIDSRLAQIGASLTPTRALDRMLAAAMGFPKRADEHGAQQ